MKKIIINTIIISLLSITTIFADNNTKNNNNQNQASSIQLPASNTNTAVVTITDLNGKTVYTATYTVNTDNDTNIKLTPNTKLAKGTYVVTIVLAGQKMTQKLIVE